MDMVQLTITLRCSSWWWLIIKNVRALNCVFTHQIHSYGLTIRATRMDDALMHFGVEYSSTTSNGQARMRELLIKRRPLSFRACVVTFARRAHRCAPLSDTERRNGHLRTGKRSTYNFVGHDNSFRKHEDAAN